MPKRANGEGTIFQRKDGRWVAEIYVLTASGKQSRRQIYGKTREEVRKKLTAKLREVDQGIPTADRAWTVGAYLTYWLEHVVRPKVRLKTFEGYESNIRLYLIPALGKKRLDKLTAAQARVFLNGLREEGQQGKGLSPRSVRYVHAILRAALQHAVREEILVRNVASLVQVSIGEPEPVQPLDVDEAKKLLSTARTDRLHALYALALGMGLRRGELLGLRWQDVDLTAGTLEIRQAVQRVYRELVFAPPKTRKSRAKLPLPQFCADALRAHKVRQAEERLAAGPRWQEHGLVFTTLIGTPIDPRNLNRLFAALCARAEVRQVRLHDLRHSCATLLLALGVDLRIVMAVLRHSAIGLTANTYTHVLPVVEREVMDRMHKLLGGDSEPGTG